MFNKINDFFSIESKDHQKYRKDRLHRNSIIEKYKSEIM